MKYFWVDSTNNKKETKLFDYKNKASFYASSAWRFIREEKLTQNPFCEECIRKGIELTPATEVDHIIPIAVEPYKALDFDNLQSLCKPCHINKTSEENRTRKNPQKKVK